MCWHLPLGLRQSSVLFRPFLHPVGTVLVLMWCTIVIAWYVCITYWSNIGQCLYDLHILLLSRFLSGLFHISACFFLLCRDQWEGYRTSGRKTSSKITVRVAAGFFEKCSKQDRQCACNLTLNRVSTTILDVEKQ